MSAVKAIVSGSLVVQPDRVQEFLAAWDVCIAITLTEKGCIAYDISVDRHEQNKFVLYEEWESAEDLAVHGGNPHVATLLETIKPLLACVPVINKFKVESI